jgi:NTE family protein
MAKAPVARSEGPSLPPPEHDHTVLVLQGGGALGAYQAGAFEGFAAAGALPDWVAGVSIGAINAAVIVGNPPERRVARLREFWDRVSALSPHIAPELLEPMRPLFNRVSAASATLFGIPGFFRPESPLKALTALAVYDTEPLRQTLLEMVDFELLNSGRVRLSVGAVNVRTGNSVYFDNTKVRLGVEHIMASGALPPGFPPVAIGGELYWDGGIVSNSPLWFVLDEAPGIDALILQVDLFSARGPVPTNLDEVQERSKDIQYSSKTRFNSSQLRERMELKAALRRLLAKLPAKLRDDPDVLRLASASQHTEISLVQLINRHDTRSSSFKDYEFSRATVNDLWRAGLDDVRRTVAHPDWGRATHHHEGMREFDLTR